MPKYNLFEILRQKRNDIARQKNIEPFKVLHNKVLEEVVRTNPKNKDDLLAIKGLGPKKVAAYGQVILDLVSSAPLELPPDPPEKILSVSEFIRQLNSILTPKRVTVLGEVGQVNPRGGYFFFKLKDKKEAAALNCFVRQFRLKDFGIDLEEGLEVKVSGFSRIFERTGNLTFDVEHIGLVREGALRRAFEKLKKELAEEGYFAPERKRPIPKFVGSLGLITSQFADAKTDFLEHLGSFGFKVYFLNVRVEGIHAVDEIASAIKYFSENVSDVDVLVLTRGGGNIESLQPFNSQEVAKAIYGSKIPVITGIGHEADVTIADLTADRRASTPTHAARILSDPWRQMAKDLADLPQDMASNFGRILKRNGKDLEDAKDGILENSARVLKAKKSGLETLKQDFLYVFGEKLKLKKSRLREQKEKLELASPLKRLKQGYSIARLGDKLIRSVDQLKIGDIIGVRLFKGEALSQVKELSDGE